MDRNLHPLPRCASSKRLPRSSNRHRFRLQLEQLEQRVLLAGDSWAWFESFDEVPRIAPAALLAESRPDPNAMGPHDLVASEWIVQLTDDAIDSLAGISAINDLLDRQPSDFTVITGLGSRGSVLLRGRSVSTADAEAVLAASGDVTSFSANAPIEGQKAPVDSFYPDELFGLTQIDAEQAWDVSTGSSTTVVGVVDTGIDLTHPDLFLNIWLNQGELPPEFLDEDGKQLVDIDYDGLITFYDLNNLQRLLDGSIVVASTGELATPAELTTATPYASGENAAFVRDLADENGHLNGRIDAADLLADANWADGRDTDGNGFFDDFFGVNFRTGAGDPFAENNPADELGHGTHVAGTIGAIGSNGLGVVGVNWQTSLMSLRILDNNNQGDSGAAIRAVNYAREMRERYRTDDAGRVTEGADVRVLNNSWGQPGGFEVSLEAAIADSYDAGILFVAAAGNGNILGNGVDNDRTPFYPASYDAPNVIAVSASDSTDNLAAFSNFGTTSVDLLAPGVGIRSTLPGGGYGSANGTSMASPHVAGTAALIWAAFPEATVDEVKQAILDSVDKSPAIPDASQIVATAGRLNARAAINANVFAPAARLVPRQDVTALEVPSTDFTIEYNHRLGININTLGDDDLIVTRQWGAGDQLPAKLIASSVEDKSVTATYSVEAPDGTWKALDFGEYVISSVEGSVLSNPPPMGGNVQAIEARDIGSFNVRIDDPSVLYVDTFADSLEPGTLRSAIIAANAAAPAAQTIILDTGTYTINIAADEIDDENTGDFDILGNVTIVGDNNDETVIDAKGIDRVFQVHPGAKLDLSRLTVTGGVSTSDLGGGGILSQGTLSLDQTIVRNNQALGSGTDPIRGGGIATWENEFTNISQSWITDNQSDFGGGIFYGDTAGGSISQSTISANIGGGLHSHSDTDLIVTNSTFSANAGGRGAIFNGKRDGFGIRFAPEETDGFVNSAISADGNFFAFISKQSTLVPFDTNGAIDSFVYNTNTFEVERVNVAADGTQADKFSFDPSLSADGNIVAFVSAARNLVPGDDDNSFDLFLVNREIGSIQRVADLGLNGPDYSLSADGKFLVFASKKDFGDAADNDDDLDIFRLDLETGETKRITNIAGREETNFIHVDSSPSITADGHFIAFLAGNTSSGGIDRMDVYRYDTDTDELLQVTDDENSLDTPSLSDDGRFIAFNRGGSNPQIYLDDLTDELAPIQISNTDSFSRYPKISGDGRFVSFYTDFDLPDQTPPDDNQVADIYVYDRETEQAKRATIGTDTLAGGEFGFFEIGEISTSMSTDGRVAMSYVAEDFVGFSPPQTFLELYDPATGQTEFLTRTSLDTVSTIHVSQVTVAQNFDADFAVSGKVELKDTLLTKNVGRSDTDIDVTADARVMTAMDAGSDLIGPLRQSGRLPPVHPLLSGNPALNPPAPATPERLPTDQRGVTRDSMPDIGAFEANAASVTGRVFVDFNQNQILNIGEPGIADVAVSFRNSDSNQDGSILSAANDQSTPLIDESGLVVFEDLFVGTTDFEISVPENFSFSGSTIRRLASPGIQPNAPLVRPSLSFDGRYVAFDSLASNLVPNDNNGRDLFVYDQVLDTYELVTNQLLNAEGAYANDQDFENLLGLRLSNLPVSYPTQLVSGNYEVSVSANAQSGVLDVFVTNTADESVAPKRVNVNVAGMPDNGGVYTEGDRPHIAISGDGRTIAFGSFGSNLVPGDDNGKPDIFIVSNPLLEPGVTLRLQTGEVFNDLNIGLVPKPGTISGRVFEDVIANGIYDENETVVEAKVFLDLNGDGTLDENEPFTTSDAQGIYEFTDIDAFRSYTIAVEVPVGFEQIGPGADQDFVWSIFLPAGGDVSDRDFALRTVSSTGQSSASAVSGRLYVDKNGDGDFDLDIDEPLAGREIYLDATNFGVRDSNEARVETKLDGTYSIEGLSSRTVAVTTTLDETFVHVTPRGSDFALQRFPLFPRITAFGNPQAIAAGDFNDDQFQDVAVALGEGDKLSIRLNDGHGGFLPDEIDIDLGKGSGPTSLVVGQFDDDPDLDVALTANFAGKVTVLWNFDSASKTFGSTQSIDVGNEPLDIAAGQFAGDVKPDLVVVNQADNTVQLLTNDGSGAFTAGAAVATGGKGSSSLVVGQFSGDEFDDVSVIHAIPRDTTSPIGGVTVLAGNGTGGLALQSSYYEVGALPIDSVTANFNEDRFADLAVANFSSNSISILLGQADGTFRVQTAILGTASGAFDIAVGDIDNDGDTDVIASNLRDRNISIFRNVGVVAGEVQFEPLENIGLGQFALAQRMPLVVGNFDNDTSGPGGTGTVDIVTIPQQTDTLHVLKNRLVDGAHRVALTGLNTIDGLDFIIKPSILPPSFDPIADPTPIVEDSPEQSVTLTGITKGRALGPPLQITATSSNTELIPDPVVDHQDGSTTATLRYTPVLDASGETTITVTVVDAGADQTIGTTDDGKFTQEFVVRVLGVGDQSIKLTGGGNTLFLSILAQLKSQFGNVQLIDITGTGDNTLMLDADSIRSTFEGGEILVVADSGDEVIFDDGWQFQQAFADGTKLVRQFSNNGATLNLRGPDDFSNPVSAFDVNADGNVTSLDALQVINELGGRSFSDGNSSPVGRIRDIAGLDLAKFRFYDVTKDNHVTALDALRVINQLGRQSVSGEAEKIVGLGPKDNDRGIVEFSREGEPETLKPVPKRMSFAAADSVRLVKVKLEASEREETSGIPAELVDAALKSYVE